MKNKIVTVAFTGGGTGGHIYPGLAVVDSLREMVAAKNIPIRVVWIGSCAGMDRKIVDSSHSEVGSRKSEVGSRKLEVGSRQLEVDRGQGTVDKFYGIPSGKLRRYFSLKNFVDFFKIGFGFLAAFFVLLKERPLFLFSKGGFVSVPPCMVAKFLGIKVYTHECDLTPGLATKINSKFASKILLSYEETKNYLKGVPQEKFVVTGNPVRPVFYNADEKIGRDFLGIRDEGVGSRNQESGSRKREAGIRNRENISTTERLGAAEPSPLAPQSSPLNPQLSTLNSQLSTLLITGGSLGAAQINELVWQNLEWLCERFVVVHQTGNANADLPAGFFAEASEAVRRNYHPFAFIYGEMPHVFAVADIVLSRAGANSIWEAAVLEKPMVLLPLEGSGTRGDQVDNAEFFAGRGAAIVIRKSEANSEKLKEALLRLLDKTERERFSAACKKITGGEKPAQKIAGILFGENFTKVFTGEEND